MSLLALGLAATLLGSAWGHRISDPRASRPYRALVFFLTGLLEIHLLLRVMGLVGLPRSVSLVAPSLLILYLVTRRLSHGYRRQLERRRPQRSAEVFYRGGAGPRDSSRRLESLGAGWGDVLAAIPWASFSLLCWQQKIVAPAFIHDWGLDAQRLASGSGDAPAAPGLVLDLYALTAELGGGFRESEILLWSSIFFLGILIAAREILARDGASPRRGANATLGDGGQLTLAILGFGLAVLGIGYPLAGAPNWLTALVLVAAVPALAEERPGRDRDLQIGVLAGLACAMAPTGLWLAGLLIAAYVAPKARKRSGWRRAAGRDTGLADVGLRAVLPAVVVVVFWFLAIPLSELRQLIPIGMPDAGRLPAALAEAAGAYSFTASSGLILGILPLPLLYLAREFRPLAVVVTLLGAGFLWAVLAAPADTTALVASALPLFALHVVPAILAAGGVMVERWRRPLPDTGEARFGSPAGEFFDSAAARHPIDEEWSDLARHWDLVLLWTARNIKLRYKRSLLGVLWSLLEPFAIITTLVIVFSSVFRFEVPSYPVYILSGWILWDFFSKATTAMTDEADDGWRLSARVRAPRSAFLLAALFTHLFNWSLALLLTGGALAVLGHPFSPALLCLPLVMALTAVFAFGIGLSVATLSVFFSDFGLLYRVLLTIWLYATPVIYPLEIIPEKIRPLFLLNPLTHILSLVRAPIYAGHFPPLSTWLIAVMLSLGAFAVGWWVFTSSRDALGYHA